ncbi:MAG TPA: hypothetical protein VFH37_01700 [Candidatus Saccharimonadales bacterium]|nr:hypothetical protein [Candidatus Saccharimonadales bacterium]
MPKPAAKKIIAVDIDDVLYPLVPSLIGYLDTKHKVKLTPKDFEAYDLRQVWHAGPKEAEQIFNDYKRNIGTDVAPLKGSAQALHRLSEKFDIVVLTSRDISNLSRTTAWIEQHFPELFKDVQLLGNSKDSINWRDKAEVCQELGIYCLIDDSLKHILQTHQAGIKTILFGDYPWNQADDLPREIVRATDWNAVLKELDAT